MLFWNLARIKDKHCNHEQSKLLKQKKIIDFAANSPLTRHLFLSVKHLDLISTPLLLFERVVQSSVFEKLGQFVSFLTSEIGVAKPLA